MTEEKEPFDVELLDVVPPRSPPNMPYGKGEYGKGAYGVRVYTTDLAATVTVTSSSANNTLDSASSEIAKRMIKQIEELEEKEREHPSSPAP